MTLIKREDAIEAIQNAYCKPCKERGDDHNEVRCRACDFDDAIIQIDAVPSAEAVHGEWIRLIEYVPESNESLINFDGYQCSVCGGKLWADSFNFWNYCPMCGARMCREDGES